MNTGPRLSYQKALHNSKLFGPEEYDDGIGNTNSNDADQDGQALANDFYEQLRKREQDEKERNAATSESTTKSEEQNDNSPTMLAEDDARFRNQELFARRREVVAGVDQPRKTKFTGQQSSPGSPFSSNANASSRGRSPTPKESMMEREFELVGKAEKGIKFQAAFAAVALAFYIYIGLSGGIVSGDAATSGDFGGDDDIPFERLMPVQRDTEPSVWL
jgi:hypothetical protein